MAKATDVSSVMLKGYWLPISFCWKMIEATEYLIGPEKVLIGRNSNIRAQLKGSVTIGSNCEIGKSIIENSVIMDNALIGDNCVIKDSVIGDRADIKDGVVIENENNGKEIKSNVKGVPMGTSRTRLGAIIGDDVTIWSNVTIKPGVNIWPGAVVQKDLDKDLVRG